MAKLSATRRRMLRRIKDRNRRFSKLNLVGQRIAIAKDVIAQLIVKKFRATPGTYVRFKLPSVSNLEQQFNETMEAVPKCEVCGVGGMFISAVRCYNDITVKEALGSSIYSPLISLNSPVMRDYLARWFSNKQVGLVESAFEQQARFAVETGSSHNEAMDAAYFGTRFIKANDRLIAICKNIISHKGKFVPPKLDY